MRIEGLTQAVNLLSGGEYIEKDMFWNLCDKTDTLTERLSYNRNGNKKKIKKNSFYLINRSPGKTIYMTAAPFISADV